MSIETFAIDFMMWCVLLVCVYLCIPPKEKDKTYYTYKKRNKLI